MLVLKRKANEKVIIRDKQTGRVIEVLVVRLLAGGVAIGFDADQSFQIDREELLKEKERQ